MNKTVIFIISVIIVGGLAFYGGMQFGNSGTAGNFPGNAQNFQGGNFPQGGMSGLNGGTNGLSKRTGSKSGNMTNGEIISKDDKSVTIKLTQGGSKIIFVSATTPIMKTTDGTIDDLAVGKTINVTGTTNTDGSVTASNIQLRPAGMQFGTQQRMGTQQIPQVPETGSVPAQQN